MKISKRASYILKFALAYKGNIGFEEMFKFYKIAPPELTLKMENLLDKDRFAEAVSLLENTLNVKLEPFNS